MQKHDALKIWKAISELLTSCLAIPIRDKISSQKNAVLLPNETIQLPDLESDISGNRNLPAMHYLFGLAQRHAVGPSR